MLRFFIHKLIESFATAIVERYGSIDERAVLFPSNSIAQRCVDFFVQQNPGLRSEVRILDLVPTSEKARAEEVAIISPKISAVIANPPWSSEKIYSKKDLYNAGFVLTTGQYDSYVLFFELAYKILKDEGVMAFIIPDSIFEAQNQLLRKFLTENTQIKVIARLGEKIFKKIDLKVFL